MGKEGGTCLCILPEDRKRKCTHVLAEGNRGWPGTPIAGYRKCPNCVLLMIGLPSMSLLEMLHRELDLPALSTAPSHCLRKSNVPLSHRSQKKTSELLEQEYEWLWICIWSSETEPGSSTRVHLHQIT